MTSISAIRWQAFAALVFILLMTAAVQSSWAGMTGADPTNITIEFKLDSRLTGGSYGGERWVSPTTFAGAGAQDTVEVRASGIGPQGQPVRISPTWVASDPAMVTVSPAEGERVKITVQHAGEATVEVRANGISKPLAIKAAYSTNAIQVQITQLATVIPATAAHQDMLPQQAAQDAKLRTRKEKLSYAVGMNLANALRKQSVEVDWDLLSQGLKDAAAGGPTLLSEQEVRTTLLEEQNELKVKQLALQSEKTKELAELNKKEGEAFLAANASKDGVVSLPGGLQYKILKAGQGKTPTANDVVVCQFRGSFIDGKQFGNSYSQKQPVTLSLRKVIKGWSQALQLMPVGSSWQLFVPSDLAYGAGGNRTLGIGPNATLIFDVELISIQDKPPGVASQITQKVP